MSNSLFTEEQIARANRPLSWWENIRLWFVPLKKHKEKAMFGYDWVTEYKELKGVIYIKRQYVILPNEEN